MACSGPIDNHARHNGGPKDSAADEPLDAIEQDLRALIANLDYQRGLGSMSPNFLVVAKATAERALELALNLKEVMARKS